MRTGLVGIYTNYRPQEIKGVKFGVIDVIFAGDLRYPTETQEIKVYDSQLCSFLIKTRAEIFNPILTMACWLEMKTKEPSFELLEVLAVSDPRQGEC